MSTDYWKLQGVCIQTFGHFPNLKPCNRYSPDVVVYLCWRLGEGDRIEWWHSVDGGYAARRPLREN